MGYPHFAPTVLWNLPLPSELGINKPASVFAFSQDDKLLITLHDCQGGILVSNLPVAFPVNALSRGLNARNKLAQMRNDI